MLPRILLSLLFCCFLCTGVRAQILNLTPVAVCQAHLNVALGPNCEATLTPEMVDAGSYTFYGSISYVSPPVVATEVGTFFYTMTISNGYRISSCFTEVTVEDKLAPSIFCQNYQIIELTEPWTMPSVVTVDDLLVAQGDCSAYSASFTLGAMNQFHEAPFTVTATDVYYNTSTCYGTVQGRQPAAPTNYCTSAGNTNYEYIERFTVRQTGSRGIWGQSGDNNGYALIGSVATLREGESVSFEHEPGYYFGGNYAEYWRVYLDMNRDGDFDDTGELIYYNKQSSGGILTGSVVLPSFSSFGDTRMRVVMAYNNYQPACSTGFWGETEDYVVTLISNGHNPPLVEDAGNADKNGFNDVNNFKVITAATERIPAIEPREAQGDIRLYPNPVSAGSQLTVNIGARSQVQSMTLRNLMGQVVSTTNVVSGQTAVELPVDAHLPAGVYLVTGHTGDDKQVWMRRVMVSGR